MIGLLKSLFARKPAPKPKPLFYSIVCPYCFQKFEPEDVMFRATHTKEDDDEFMTRVDDKLSNWRKRFQLGLDVVDMPAVIDPATIPDENKTYSGHVLTGITDRYGETTTRRICPECHNELPVSAGMIPSNIISIVGATEVGKSVFIASLVHTLQNTTASNFDAACHPLTPEVSRRFKQNFHKYIFELGTMMEATQATEQIEPYIFQFIFKDEQKEPLTLVFFDVAGEGMTRREYMELQANHIKNSSGILFLVDPLQIKTIRDKIMLNLGQQPGDVPKAYAEPTEVVASLYENFIAFQPNGKTDIPTAICLTKSDMLQYLKEEDSDYIQPNSNVFSNVIHRGYLDNVEFENINGEVSRFLDKVDRPFKNAVDVYFTNKAFFAISALGTNPVNKQINGVVTPTRVDEPFVWLLHKLGYIERRDPA